MNFSGVRFRIYRGCSQRGEHRRVRVNVEPFIHVANAHLEGPHHWCIGTLIIVIIPTLL